MGQTISYTQKEAGTSRSFKSLYRSKPRIGYERIKRKSIE